MNGYGGIARVARVLPLVATMSLAAEPPRAIHRINCGGDEYTDGTGALWSADYGFSTGLVASNTSELPSPLKEDPRVGLYTSERFHRVRSGPALAYNLALPAADVYLVRLYFADTCHCTYTPVQVGGRYSHRNFGIKINGVVAVAHFDPIAQAGWGTAIVQEFSVTVSEADNNHGLNIQLFHGTVQNPMINAIEVLRLPTHDARGAANVQVSTTPPSLQTTSPPTTLAPITATPTTIEPTTAYPNTVAPTDVIPITAAPTTAAPTSNAPITATPTTAVPTSNAPSTATTTSTAVPTSTAPITAAPTTSAPTSRASAEEIATLVPITPTPLIDETTVVTSSTSAPRSPLTSVGELTSDYSIPHSVALEPESGNCPYPPHIAFQCAAAGLTCISADSVCDGVINCDDGIDETICQRLSSASTSTTTDGLDMFDPKAEVDVDSKAAHSNSDGEHSGMSTSKFEDAATNPTAIGVAGSIVLLAGVVIVALRRRRWSKNSGSFGERNYGENESLPELDQEWDHEVIQTAKFSGHTVIDLSGEVGFTQTTKWQQREKITDEQVHSYDTNIGQVLVPNVNTNAPGTNAKVLKFASIGNPHASKILLKRGASNAMLQLSERSDASASSSDDVVPDADDVPVPTKLQDFRITTTSINA